MIPYGKQSVSRKDIRAVSRSLKSDWLTQGPAVRRFEEAFAKYCQAPYAVAVSSGTAALHLAYLALGLGPNKKVVVPPMSFVATANAALYTGASVCFADIENQTLALDAQLTTRAIDSKISGACVVHFAGQSAIFLRDFLKPKRKSFFVLEDACHALGATYTLGGRNYKVGSCEHSDAAIFSFHPVKHITTGEGGMITTRRKDVYERLLLLRSHGITKDPNKFTHRASISNPWHYEMQELGFNYRISDFQCELGLSQLKRLDSFVQKRQEIAEYYFRNIPKDSRLMLPLQSDFGKSSFHLFVLRLAFSKIGLTRRQVMDRLSKAGIGTQVHYIPIYRQPYYVKQSFAQNPDSFPVTESYYEQALSVPIYPSMTMSDCKKVVQGITGLLKQ